MQSVIITSLPSSKIVKDTFRSITEKGAFPQEEDRVFIDCSTIDPGSSRQVAKEVRETLNAHFVDAPMSGGAVGAQEGSLSFMFGAPSESGNNLAERIKSILLLMGEKTWHMGDQGCGVSSKLCNNYILAINNIATSEALNMGRELGLDVKALTELINSSTGHCWPMEVNNPAPGVVSTAPASNGYDPGCPIGMINKDLGLAMAGAKECNIPLLLADRAHEIYNKADEDFHGRDFSIIYKWLQSASSKS